MALSLCVASGCKGDAAHDTVRGAAATSAPKNHAAESFGDVVIAPPATPYAVTTIAAPGTVSGTVTLKGALPVLPPTPTGKDGAVCGALIPDLSVQQQSGGLGGVVVWLDGARRGKALGLERRLELESDHCKLVPRVQAAVIGSAVNIIGHDDVRQHLRFTAGGDTAPRALILLGGGEQVIPTELPFKAPGMVSVHDADRPWTRAYLAVFDHPYFTVTSANGSFSIDGVPPGTYTLHAWHERAGTTAQAIQIGAGGLAKVSVILGG